MFNLLELSGPNSILKVSIWRKCCLSSYHLMTAILDRSLSDVELNTHPSCQDRTSRVCGLQDWTSENGPITIIR